MLAVTTANQAFHFMSTSVSVMINLLVSTFYTLAERSNSLSIIITFVSYLYGYYISIL